MHKKYTIEPENKISTDSLNLINQVALIINTLSETYMIASRIPLWEATFLP